MFDGLWFSALWVLLVTVVSFIAAGTLWILGEPFFLALLVPRRQVEALADAVMREHPGDPEERAFLEEHAAWHRSRCRERALWRRVRRKIRRRRETKAPPPLSGRRRPRCG